MTATRRARNSRARDGAAAGDDGYKWVALANTTAAVFMSTLDGSIVLIAMPAIFAGIHLDPLSPSNISYLLWMIMGYRLVQAVFVVTVGRLGDIFGRVRLYNAGFMVFTLASVALSFDPFRGASGALWLIGWRVPQALGGSMLMANSAAILTDAFPENQRGFALGTNQIAALAGMFIGLVAGGVLATIDWRAIFWVNVPVGIYGTLWAYWRLRETGERHRSPIDWWGNLTFAVGLASVLIAVTYGIQPYGGHTMGWTNPFVLGLAIGGLVLLVAFVMIEQRVPAPMIDIKLFRIRAFTAGNIASLCMSISRGGLQFMLVIWLQGIWLPLHGYSFAKTPLWAGIYMLPLTVGFLLAGPASGTMSDRIGSRGIATTGAALTGVGFIGMMLLPVDFSYAAFAALLFLIGVATGMFTSPNTRSIMSSVPASQRGVASGMRATFQNSGTALSIGVFFTLMIIGLASSLPHTLSSGLQHAGLPHGAAQHLAGFPPVSSLFATVLGINPLHHLLQEAGQLHALTPAALQMVTGRGFFPHLLIDPFHDGLMIVFLMAAALSAIAAISSYLRGGRPVLPAPAEREAPPEPAADVAV
jgi:EmrB/QacA subfamily drug resistance transporter